MLSLILDLSNIILAQRTFAKNPGTHNNGAYLPWAHVDSLQEPTSPKSKPYLHKTINLTLTHKYPDMILPPTCEEVLHAPTVQT